MLSRVKRLLGNQKRIQSTDNLPLTSASPIAFLPRFDCSLLWLWLQPFEVYEAFVDGIALSVKQGATMVVTLADMR